MINSLTTLLKEHLSADALETLNGHLTLSGSEERLMRLKSFFLRENIFTALKPYCDPMLIANELSINHEKYGF